VLGDRSILYKYLNPNTLLVALGDSLDADDDAPPALSVLLLDSVTGRVLHSQVQLAASGPVQLLLTENLGVMQFWDAAARRVALLSLEAYDASDDRTFSVLDYLFNPNSTRAVSSYDNATLDVRSAAFWPRTHARFLSATRTQQGITSKQVLIGTETNQLYALDARLLDPRRPKTKKLSAHEVEERLIPYSEYLPLMPTAFATYDKQVAGLNSVLVEPSRLESTCLVLAVGVDLFYTRVAPARKYDSVEDDFQFGLLVLALTALTCGAVAMSYMTKRKVLAAKWE
jgi:hypothetical protein